MALAKMLLHLPYELVIARSGQPFTLRFQTLDENMQPGILTEEMIYGLDLRIYTQQNSDIIQPLRACETEFFVQELKGGEGTYEATVTLSGKTGTYALKLSHLGSMEGVVVWDVLVEHGNLSEIIPFLRSTEGNHGPIESDISSLQVVVGEMFPSLEVELLDSEHNLCTRYDLTGFLNLRCRNCPEWKLVSTVIVGGTAVFEAVFVNFDTGDFELYFEFGMSVAETVTEYYAVPYSRSITLQVIAGNYPSQITLEAEVASEIYLSDIMPQFLPEVEVLVGTTDGRRLKDGVKIGTTILDIESNVIEVTEGGEPEIVCCNIYDVPTFINYDISNATAEQPKGHCGKLKYSINQLYVPRRAGKYLLVIHLDDSSCHVGAISRPFLVKHGPPNQIVPHQNHHVGQELEQLEVMVYDIHGNLCSESFGKLGFSLTLGGTRLSARDSEDIGEPCQLLSRSTGDLIAGVCKFDKFEITYGIEGMYLLKVFYEVRSEHVILSATQVLITGGNLVQSVLERLRELQSLTQDLKAKEHETSQIKEELCLLKDCGKKLEIEIEILTDEIKESRDQERKLSTLHLKDEELLEREELLEHTFKTHEDVRKAIKKFPWPKSSPLEICDRKRKSREKCGQISTIQDMVVMLARVEDNRLNSILSAYLGDSNLLLIVCQTRDELKEFNMFNKWKGRCDIICLEELGCCGILVDNSHRQQLLQLPEPSWNDGERPQGFLGFAVNMIHLKPDHMHLRGTLFYYLLGESQVYDTEENMKIGLKNLRGLNRAMSLDGAIVKNPYRHQFGRGGPAIRFPSVSFAERSRCSLVPPASDAFEREKRWNELHEQIVERSIELLTCEERKFNITVQIILLEDKIILQTIEESDLQEMVTDLAKKIDTIKTADELLQECKMRVFQAKPDLT